MTTAAPPATAAAPAAADADEFGLQRAIFVNIEPILESVAGLLADEEIDQWFHDFERLNEGRGFDLELTREGELVITPMVNRDGSRAEMRLGSHLDLWAEEYGGEAHGANANMRLPDGSRIRPDALWLSPEQVAELPPISHGGAITVCPAFVAEIRSRSDSVASLHRKMRLYIANGALLGWLIDPYRRQVHVYRPDAEPQTLEDPETISGEPVMPGFVFEVRRRIFDLHEPPQQG